MAEVVDIVLAPGELRWWIGISEMCPQAPPKLRHDVATAAAAFWTWAKDVTPHGEGLPDDVVEDPLMASWLYHYSWWSEQLERAIKRIDDWLGIPEFFNFCPQLDDVKPGALVVRVFPEEE